MLIRLLLSLIFISLSINAISKNIEKPDNWEEMALTDKIRWRSSHLNPKVNYALFVNKLKVKEYVKPYIKTAKVLYVVDDPDNISLNNLPSSFALKAVHGCRLNVIVEEGNEIWFNERKKRFDKTPVTDSYLQEKAKTWLERRRSCYEHQYNRVERNVIVEEYLGHDLTEYQFWCFDGKVKFISTVLGTGKTRTVDFHDLDWNFIPVRYTHLRLGSQHPIPPLLEELKNVAEKLTQGIDFVRLDLSVADDTIYFGEYTFSPNNGKALKPDNYNALFGKYWEYPSSEAPKVGW